MLEARARPEFWSNRDFWVELMKLVIERKKLKEEVPGLTAAHYTGYLWRHTIRQIEAQNGLGSSPRIRVIGPDTSDALLALLMQKSPLGGRGMPLRVYSPFASIETDLLLHRLKEQTANRSPEFSENLRQTRKPSRGRPTSLPLGSQVTGKGRERCCNRSRRERTIPC